MVGIYTRVSTGTQAQTGFSLDIQKEKGIYFAKSLGEDYQIFEDAGVSGGTFDREQFQIMLTKIKSGEINKVWCIHKDRLTRASLDEALYIRDIFRDHNVKLFLDGQLLHLTSPEDLLQSNILDSIAEYQRLIIKKKTTEGRHKGINEGYQAYCMVYGYDFKYLPNGKKEWYINEDEADMIRYIYDLYFQDLGYSDICRVLERDGYKTKRKGNWDFGTIGNILKRPEYVGLTRNTKGELIESKIYEPIIDKTVWDKVQKTIESKTRARQGKYFRKAFHELSGVLTCSQCGAKHYYHVTPMRTGNKKTTYAHKQIKVKNIECTQSPLYFNSNISEYLMRVLFINNFNHSDNVKKFILELEGKIGKESENILDSINRKKDILEDLKTEKKKLINALMKGIVEDDDISDELQELKIKINKTEIDIKELKVEYDVKNSNVIDVINSFSDDIVEQFLYSSPVKKRDMYLKFCTHVKTNGYNIEVKFINGVEEIVNIRDIPLDILNDMVLYKFIDLNPEYDAYKKIFIKGTSLTRNAKEDYFKSSYYEEFFSSMPNGEFYERLNTDREVLHKTFTIKKGGRTRKKKKKFEDIAPRVREVNKK